MACSARFVVRYVFLQGSTGRTRSHRNDRCCSSAEFQKRSSMKLFHVGLFTIFLLLSATIADAQQPHTVHGVVLDSATGEPLGFATIRVDGTDKGAVAGRDGRFSLRLSGGRYRLVASYVGYGKVRQEVDVDRSTPSIEFRLTPLVTQTPTIVVSPEDPARRLLRKAIARKVLQVDSLQTYSHLLYTRFTAATDTSTAGRATGRGDTTIVSIFESYSRGYYRRPDDFFNEIIQRRQTANIPPQGNFVVFGTNLNAYDDFVRILGEDIYTPFHPDALDFYDVAIEYVTNVDDTTSIAHLRVTPTGEDRRAFYGTIDLNMTTFAPLKVDFKPNQAVQLPFDAWMHYVQTFDVVDNRWVVPSGMHIAASVSADILWIFSPRLDVDIETVAYDYEVNRALDGDLFSQRRVEASDSAETLDSAFWQANEVLPLSTEELAAYEEIRNSIDAPDSNASGGGGIVGKILGEIPATIALLNRRPFTGVEDFFRYNRIHGPYLGGGVYDNVTQWLELGAKGGYGFSDRRWYAELSSRLLLDDLNHYSIDASAYRRLSRRDNPWIVTTQGITPLALIFGSDYGDYYYTEGVEGGVEAAFGQLRFLRRDQYIRPDRLRIFLRSERHDNAVNGIAYSLLGGDNPFRPNPPALPGVLRSIGGELNLGYAPGRRFGNIGLQLTAEIGDARILPTDFTFRQFTGTCYVRTRTLPLWQLDVRLSGGYTEGDVPPQRFFSLESAVASIAGEAAFRGMSVKEFYGDRFVSLAVEHNFGEVIPGILRIPNIASFGIEFLLMGRVGWTDFSQQTLSFTSTTLPTTEGTSDRYYYEIGIGMNRLLFFFRVDLSARLSQTERPQLRFTFSGATN